jgi:acetyltransferase-like isoleucine patch superfamily enzyme
MRVYPSATIDSNTNETRSKEISRMLPPEQLFSGILNRVFAWMALYSPGARSLRIWLHRRRGVKIGSDVQIGNDVILETAYPQWISIGNGVQMGIRTTIVAHMHGLAPRKDQWKGYVSVRIEDEANIGVGVLILPNVTIGKGAVVNAGSVVTCSVPPMTVVQGNPAKPVAKCGVPLTWNTTLKDFVRNLRPIEDDLSSRQRRVCSSKDDDQPVEEEETYERPR